MKDLLTIGKKWRLYGIISIVVTIVSLIVFTLSFVFCFGTNDISLVLLITFVVISSILLLAAETIGFVISIKILSIKWEDEELEKSKETWGMLGIFFLGPISALVFGNKIINKYK